MSIEDQLRAIGHDLIGAQEPITVDELRRGTNAGPHAGSSPPGRRLLLIAAVVILVAGGLVSLVAIGANGDDPLQPADSGAIIVPDPTARATTPAPVTTVAPATTTTVGPSAESGWSGGLLDDLDTESLRPLASYADGDVIIPTGPSGWRVEDAGWMGDDPGSSTWQVVVTEAPPDSGFGQVLYLTMGEDQACTPASGCVPWGEPMTINGVGWQAIVPVEVTEGTEDFVTNMSLSAQVGDRWVSVAAAAAQLLDGPLLENPPIIEFLEGLRVGSPDDLAAIGEACWQCGVAGAEGDPFAAVESAPATSTTITDGTPTTTSEVPAPNDAGSDTGRPLTDLAEGDVVVPTYIPSGLQLGSEARIDERRPSGSEFSFTLETDDGEYSSSVRLWENGPIGPAVTNDPNHPHVEIAGLTWEWNDFEMARVAHIGSYSVWVYLRGLDRSEAERFIAGLRAAPIAAYPGAIAVDGADGLSVVGLDESADAEIVASDDRFELAAVRVGEQVCTKLTETVVPVTATFAAECWESERLDALGVVDLYALDGTESSRNARYLVIGIVDATNTTSARITSPSGESVVVPTGPANEAIDGRFFLAHLELDDTDGIRLDNFTIEDASP